MRRFPLLMLLSLTSVLWTAPSYASPPEHQQLVTQVIELEGSYKLFEAIPTAFDALAAGEQLVAKDTDQGKEPSASSLLPEFDLTAAKRDFARYLADHADDKSLAVTLSWLQTSLGKRFADEESLVSGGLHQVEILVYLAQLKSNPLPKSRVELIQRFAEESNAAELQVKMTKGLLLSMAASFSAGSPEAESNELQELFAGKEKELLESARKQVILTSFYTYRSFTDDELEQYIAFMKSDDYKRFSQAYAGAVEAGLTTTFKAIGKKIADQAKESGKGEEACSE